MKLKDVIWNALFVVVLVAITGCAGDVSGPAVHPQYDGGGSNPGIGESCDPQTYSGPYRCIPDETSNSGYVVAY